MTKRDYVRTKLEGLAERNLERAKTRRENMERYKENRSRGTVRPYGRHRRAA